MPKHLLLFCAFVTVAILPSYSQPVLVFTPAISSGLNSPVDVVAANDGSNRVFIVQQGGTISVYDNTYTLLNNNFLTIATNISTGGERGLLSAAFHPDYENNRYFFVYYTNAAGGINIDRFQTLLANPNQADAATRTNIMTIDKPVAFTNHNGGKLNFGPDGHLYFGLGDAGSGGDPRNFAQRGDSLWGKMVRINVDNFTTPPYFTIPADNPFIADPAILDEIFSLGLRNPFRWSFDRLNGNTWIADVGQNAREEINVLTPIQANGANYGWRCYEGLMPYNTTGCLPAASYVSPVFDYPHNGSTGGFSVTGGYVYRGSVYPAMYGYYICSDYVSGNAWVINASTYAAAIQTGAISNTAAYGELENGELVALSLSGVLYSVSTSTVLPLKLLHWGGQAFNQYNLLSWQTADEINVQQFEVEYSNDAVTFKNAGTITAKNENRSAYSFRHYIPATVLYYRLKTLDLNGSVKYSNTITLKNKTTAKEQLIYSYNGNTKLLWLNITPNEKVSFQLYNLSGQNIITINNYVNNSIIDLQKIPAGLYVGKIMLKDEIVSKKIWVR